RALRPKIPVARPAPRAPPGAAPSARTAAPALRVCLSLAARRDGTRLPYRRVYPAGDRGSFPSALLDRQPCGTVARSERAGNAGLEDREPTDVKSSGVLASLGKTGVLFSLVAVIIPWRDSSIAE